MQKRLLNLLIIIILTAITLLWTTLIFHEKFNYTLLGAIVLSRIVSSFIIYKDYSLSWSKATNKTFLIKSLVYFCAFLLYLPLFYKQIEVSFLVSELFFYLFAINFSVYIYAYAINKKRVIKSKELIIYGAGQAGVKLYSEFGNSEYKVRYFIDDKLEGRSIDGIAIISRKRLQELNKKFDLLIFAMPRVKKEILNRYYDELAPIFEHIRIIPSIESILLDKPFSKQLKDIAIEDLLAREPKDLDKSVIKAMIDEKVVLITGAGGSIGSELAMQVQKYGAKQIILVEHSEFNLYQIHEKLRPEISVPKLLSILDVAKLEAIFKNYTIDIILHAAAYKHVHICEENIESAIENNIIGTKNVIDLAIEHNISRVVNISTDKAVRPTNVMGTTKRINELYVGNVEAKETIIASVRFGNVLGSSGSVIPKFKAQIEKNQNLTVTHPDITRYFMLIDEACQLVLQAGAISQGKELFILDMGEPVKIADLARKMIKIYGKELDVVYTGLRAGEKLYEELLISDSELKTKYDSIHIAQSSKYDYATLCADIENLLKSTDKIKALQHIVPEFQPNQG